MSTPRPGVPIDARISHKFAAWSEFFLLFTFQNGRVVSACPTESRTGTAGSIPHPHLEATDPTTESLKLFLVGAVCEATKGEPVRVGGGLNNGTLPCARSAGVEDGGLDEEGR